LDTAIEHQGVDRETLSPQVIGCAIEVHRALGPGLLGSAYAECMCAELAYNGLAFEREVALPIFYRGRKLDCSYRMDIVVAGLIVLELKTVQSILPVHEAQLLTYLRLSGMRIGLILNFHVNVMKNGALALRLP
jgi:GxxExxY protein